MAAYLIILTALLSTAVSSEAAGTRDPFYIIAHMANSPDSLDWSVKEGANAIEVDIRFDNSGRPYMFEHGGLCDCTCPHLGSFHICKSMKNRCSGSGASNDAVKHLRHLARLPGVALLIVDSKVHAGMGGKLQTAGSKIVSLLQRHLFAAGYRGNVVVSAGKINCFDYVYMAAMEAARTPNADRFYFSFDQEGNSYHDVTAMLSRFTRNRAYGTGVTSCSSGNYKDAISKAVNGVRSGQIGMSYIWTLDNESSMQAYIDLGVHGIITNRVGLLKRLVKSNGLRLAAPSDKIPVARADLASPSRCDCDYHKGGCIVSFPPPTGNSCRCRYRGFWSCSGSLAACSWRQEKCRSPDASREACRLGGGDCGGYP